jgi:hypothetical protein
MLQQVADRAILRITDGRTRAIDLIALNSPEAPCSYRFHGSLKDLLGVFEEDQEFLNLTNDIENIHGWENSEFWKNVKVISEGYQRFETTIGDLKTLVEQKNQEQVEGVLGKIENNKTLVSGSDPEYWNLCEFLLRYRLAVLTLRPFFTPLNLPKDSNLSDIKLFGIEEYIKWREAERCKLDSKLIKEGFDNSPNAISFQITMEKTYLFPLQRSFFHTAVNPGGDLPDSPFPRYFAVEYRAIPWTKHNRLFYDKGSPPEPVTIGYRFDLFYSQMKTSSKPTYRVKEIDYNWALLTFSFRPMYRDVSFKISNLTWDMIHRGNGFLCKYEDDVLTLRFWFKERKHLSTKFTE